MNGFPARPQAPPPADSGSNEGLPIGSFSRSQSVDHLPEIATAFVMLLLLPTLGVVGLLQKRAIPVLCWTIGIWAAFGAWALFTHHTFDWSEKRFLRGWVLGLVLGGAFLFVAWLRNQPRVAPWVKIGLGLVTVTVFVRALWAFVMRYA